MVTQYIANPPAVIRNSRKDIFNIKDGEYYLNEQDDLKNYYKSLKIQSFDADKIKKQLSQFIDFPLFKEGIMQVYTSDVQLAGLKILGRLTDANSWITKANDLYKMINYSVISSLSVLEKCDQIFIPYRVTEEYKLVFYYVENALFRLFMAWDVLGQMYNHLYDMKTEVAKVNYTRIFEKTSCDFMNNWLERVIGHQKAIEFIKNEYFIIKEYISTNYEYDSGITKGHHKYLKSIRNMAIHREDPHNYSIINNSDRKMPLVDAPQYELMNIVADSMKLYQYISTIIKLYYFEFRGYGIDVGELQVIRFEDE